MANQNVQTTRGYQQQANQATDVAIYRLTDSGIKLPDYANTNLAAFGYTESDIRQMTVMALACGIKVEALAEPSTIVALKQAYSMVVDYGARPGLDFYAIDYGSRTWGSGGGDDEEADSTKKPKIAIVRSVNWLRHNVEEYLRLLGLQARPRRVIVMNEEQRNEIIAFYRPNAVPNKANRVAKMRFEVLGQRYEDDEWSYGFYLHEGITITKKIWDKKANSYKKDAKGNIMTYEQVVGPDSKLLSANNPMRQGPEVAGTRAERDAARVMTRTDFPLDKAPVDVRLAKVLEASSQRIIQQLEDGTFFQRRITGGTQVTDVPEYSAVEEEAIGSDISAAEDAVDAGLHRDQEAERPVEIIDGDTVPEGAAFNHFATLEDLFANAWRLLPQEQRALVNDLAASHEQGKQKIASEAGYTKLVDALHAQTDWVPGDQVEEGITKLDVLLACLFGTIPHAVPASVAAKKLFDELNTGGVADATVKSLVGIINDYCAEAVF